MGPPNHESDGFFVYGSLKPCKIKKLRGALYASSIAGSW